MLKRFLIGMIAAIGLLLSVAIGLYLYVAPDAKNASNVRIGYFHGGGAVLLLRTYINNQFEKQGASVQLITRAFKGGAYVSIPKRYNTITGRPGFGKVLGPELLNEIMRGKLDGAAIGEGSFVMAVARGMPVVAVAELGHDTVDKPAHALVFRNDVVIEKPSDIIGKRIATREAGPTDSMIMREFLESAGINADDVSLQDQVDEETILNRIARGDLDGGYLSVRAIERLINAKKAPVYIYRKLDWINPELSHSLLVFRQDFVEQNPKKVENIIRAYMEQIQLEHNLSQEERLHDPGEESRGVLQMETDFLGMNLPQYDLPPTVSLDLLDKIQNLLLKYGFINIKVDLSGHVDNSFVEKIYAEEP